MSIATTIVKSTPIFGKMFAVDKSTGLEEINAWPALMIMSSFVWLAVAGLLGLVMPTTQIFDLSSDHFYTTLTLHGAACHACLFAPETSCERGNRYLDRALLVKTLSVPGVAFFGA